MQVTLGPYANNGPAMKPTLIITRPVPDGARFAGEVAAHIDVPTILSPLQEIVPLDTECDAGGYLFTSSNGVAQASRLGLSAGPAWCVGDRTAQMARDAGFDAQSANGNAEDLIAMVLNQRPAIALAHIRGRAARGDIAPRLSAAGIHCDDVIAYDQRAIALTKEAKVAIEGVNPVIIPLFSPRTASLLLEQIRLGSHIELIAISQVTANALAPHHAMVVDAPNGVEMLAAVVNACNKVSPA